MAFMTQKAVEELLQRHTRSFTLPDGTREYVSTDKLCWNCYDLVMEFEVFTFDEFVALVRQMMAETGEPFARCFQSIASYAHSRLKDTLK